MGNIIIAYFGGIDKDGIKEIPREIIRDHNLNRLIAKYNGIFAYERDICTKNGFNKFVKELDSATEKLKKLMEDRYKHQWGAENG